ncbi:MAG: UDP-N-acetylmuramoyl-tripeptide--D-alanyl-D-alanine ligase [Actinomycetaceae bacterium]|nr:UDP-N-acetylmuramoyl-tripeptide--D-alanyl-D-alanine ligase [Arcanobacterium sp.]MDD7687357.1 UDP-N-acetylmuramoyl-tripeptide--D-alanyl-D-alanine ligase [Actinomycetaceae bacterium]MDY5274126.1 UDP-N-acetylmuramoyl-tripeptide--D-alanyl-D-alanine ligase [Arcanobacterium sp.]
MIPTSLSVVAEQCGGKLLAAPATAAPTSEIDPVVSSVVTDNRRVSQGSLFVAIKGERVDGNSYAGAALSAGAAGILSDNPQLACESGASADRVIAVDDSVAAMGRLARRHVELVRAHGRADFKVVAVTGSVGKTTTKDLLAALLADRGPLVAPPHSFNNPIGMPVTALRVDEQTATLVLEMGADHIGDIEQLAAIAPPDVAIVLIVARAHLGEFGGIDNVAKAKSELVLGARAGAPVILNGDDVRVAHMGEIAHGPVWYFSTRGRMAGAGVEAAIYATDIRVDEADHAEFTLHTPAGEAPVRLALVGEHHVANALAAASAAHVLGIPLERIAQVLSTAGAASAHRMAVSTVAGATVIDDSYNANPDSMRAGIRALTRLGRGRRMVAVLGKMNELGEHSTDEHRSLGCVVAESGVDVLVGIGDDGDVRALVDSAQSAAHSDGKELQTVTIADVDEARRIVPTLIVSGDVVLLKGSNSSSVWKIANALTALAEPTQHDDIRMKGE